MAISLEHSLLQFFIIIIIIIIKLIIKVLPSQKLCGSYRKQFTEQINSRL